MSFKNLEKEGLVILKRFTENFNFPSYATPQWLEKNHEHIRSAVVVDLETTGLNSQKDLVIEIALKEIKFDRRNGHLLKIGKIYTSLQDIKQEIPENITRLTGLDANQLKGHEIDWIQVGKLISEADVLIAHHAKFEKSFLDSILPLSSSKIWACSIQQIDWASKGYNSSKLEILSIYHGFYVDSHRAMNDVNALIHLLSFKNLEKDSTYLHDLLESAKQSRIKIEAFNSPFESKDHLKSRGYNWDPAQRYWYKSLLESDQQEEVHWLEENVYCSEFKGQIKKLKLCDHFKS